MDNNTYLNKINNELKVYLNEAKFVSNKCRNKIIKILSDEFNANISSDYYADFANVDVKITEDFKISIRGKEFESNDIIKDISDLENRYNSFKDKADRFMSNKKLTFDNMNTFDQVLNLILIGVLFIFIIALGLLTVFALFNGNFSFSIWLIVFILPACVPKIKENLIVRIDQASNFIKRLFKKSK